MKQLPAIFVLLLSLLCISPLKAQYNPDTTLDYETFLRQCVQFKQQVQNEVWVVNFWATWNPSSFDNLPQLKTSYLRYMNRPVRFVSISVDKNRRIWETQVMKYQLPWEQMFLPSEADYSYLKKAFRHNSFPAIFVVNPEGKIRRVQNMEDFYAVMDREVSSLPNQKYEPGFANNDDGFTDSNNGDNSSDKGFEGSEEIDAPSDPGRTTNPDPDVETRGNWIVHTVQPKETLFALYRKYGVSVEEIQRVNGLRGNNIQIGQVLKIKQR